MVFLLEPLMRLGGRDRRARQSASELGCELVGVLVMLGEVGNGCEAVVARANRCDGGCVSGQRLNLRVVGNHGQRARAEA